MKKILTIILLVATSSAPAQLKTTISDYYNNGFGYPVEGIFEVIKMPTPLEEAVVKFTLKVINDDKSDYASKRFKSDWNIFIGGYDESILQLTSDSTYIWPGPHKMGDTFTGEIRCVTLASGKNGFQIALNRITNTNFNLFWMMDEKGIIKKLDKYQFYYGDQDDHVQTFFFNPDSTYFRRKHRYFNSEVTITPTPQIGDTSLVHLRLLANENLPIEFDQIIRTDGLEMITFPEGISYPIIRDQVLDLYFKFVPNPVYSIVGFSLQLLEASEQRKRRIDHNVSVAMLFNNEGQLQFITDQAFYNEKKYMPTAFKGNKATNHIYKILHDRSNEVIKVK